INHCPVGVHKGGGWLAFLPVKPGNSLFNVQAEKDGVRDSVILSVSLADLPRYAFDTLAIVPQSLLPAETLFIQADDEFDLGFDGTPYCEAICVVKPYGDTIPMVEAPPQSLSGDGGVFGADGAEKTCPADSLSIRGHYVGVYRTPITGGGPLAIEYRLKASTERLKRLVDIIPATVLASLSHLADSAAIKIESLKVPVFIMNNQVPAVVEFIDSMTTIRTGPRQGYLSICQPAGVRTEMAGRLGRWLKLRLTDCLYGWVPDTSVTILPTGTPLTPAVIPYVQTIDNGTSVSVLASTSQRVPFRVEENPAENSLTIFLYGAKSNTDWIRYDTRDSLITRIQWTQPQTETYVLTVFLKDPPLWGYDAYYDGTRFRLDIRKRGTSEIRISDLRFVIDPGHSPDPGAIGPTGLAEKEINLAIARKLKTQLERRGAEVVLTRNDTSGISLYDRPKLAVRERADIFISIHNNALPDGVNPFVNNGVATYYYHPHSEPLARAVQARLARETGLKDFGLFYGNLAVDRPSQFPSILIEGAFIMLPDQEAKLKTDRFQTKLARAIAAGIMDYLTAVSESR
ncbi:MAG: N-acetylmuramoyl-L-alanine amidase, partial [candidate division Zixibacteria bacterium]|nr:N-acetylmuramoyl-L-alanine amidase [candidate division Zixibacteria bacterium]